MAVLGNEKLVSTGGMCSMVSQLTCTIVFWFGVVVTLLILLRELSPLEADDSLDSNDTVSLNAESLSGLSVRDDSLVSVCVVTVLEMVELVPDTIEFDRLCCWLRVLSSPFCSRRLSSLRIESSSDSCVSSRFAIEKRYELIRSDFGTLRLDFGRSFTGDWYVSKPCKWMNESENCDLVNEK